MLYNRVVMKNAKEQCNTWKFKKVGRGTTWKRWDYWSSCNWR